jgi:uncharacterized peroxidase-related enzyme
VFDYRTADLSPLDRAMCDYAVKLTRTPGAMNEADLAPLRAGGLSDEQITVATQVIAYFNYINRIADALGVDDESWMTLGRDAWLRRKGRDYASC